MIDLLSINDLVALALTSPVAFVIIILFFLFFGWLVYFIYRILRDRQIYQIARKFLDDEHIERKEDF